MPELRTEPVFPDPLGNDFPRPPVTGCMGASKRCAVPGVFESRLVPARGGKYETARHAHAAPGPQPVILMEWTMLKVVMLDAKFFPGKDAYVKVEAICNAKGVAFEPLYGSTNEELIEQAQGADACMLTDRKIGPAFLDAVPSIKMFVRCGMGFDNLDLPEFTKRGVYACNVPDYAVEEVAVHTIALVLTLERKIPLYNKDIHNGAWNEEIGYPMHRLTTRTLGILGLGRIARRFSIYAKALGYTLIASDPFLPDHVYDECGVKKVDQDTLFAQSDVLAGRAAGGKDTYHIINDENLAKMKDGSLLVTTSRGSLVDLPSLARALDSGKLYAAALDVLEEEPPTEKAKILLGRDNVILTPHTAYKTVEAMEAMRTMAAETAVEFLTEGKLRNVVNPDVIGRAKQ